MADIFESRLLRLRFRCRRRLGVTDEEFWSLTPRELALLEKDWRRDFALDNYVGAVLATAFLSANRAVDKKTGKPKGKAPKLVDVLPFGRDLFPQKRRCSDPEKMLAWARMATAALNRNQGG